MAEKNKRFNKKIIGVLAACLFILLIILSSLYFSSMKSKVPGLLDTDSTAEVVDSIVEMTKVERMQFESVLGSCQYTGYVDMFNRPDDPQGEAYFNDGRYYKGGFENGVLTGSNAYFKYPNGDVFKGTFKNNAFDWGEYTIAEDGSYFHGSFKNGQPDKGNWFDKNGIIIQ